MGRLLSNDEWVRAIWDYEHTAYRLELQARYGEPSEEEYLQRFLAGDMTPPANDDAWRQWCDQVAASVLAGKRIERVRVFEAPPTDYQRWLRWASGPNIEAGEVIRYMTQSEAARVGLPGADAGEDWWLLDDSRLVVMRFRPSGERYENELIDDPDRVAEARRWWDLAVHHSTPDLLRGASA